MLAQRKGRTVLLGTLLSGKDTSSSAVIKDTANIPQRQYTDSSIKIGCWGCWEEVLRTASFDARCIPIGCGAEIEFLPNFLVHCGQE